MSEEQKASDTQIGGNHYKDFKIQPTEFIHKNNLGYIQGNIIKYACRYKNKNGIEDLKKIKHYVDLLIEFEGYNEQKVKDKDLIEGVEYNLKLQKALDSINKETEELKRN